MADVRLQQEIKDLEIAVEGMQEEVNIWRRALQKKHDALAGAMGPVWQERLRSVREGAYPRAQYLNDLRATKEILSRRLKALMAERKVYDDYSKTDSFRSPAGGDR